MSVTFRILPERALVYVRYEGVVRPEDGFAALRDYAEHPDCRPGQRHLVDLSAATEVERDFMSIFRIQALKADILLPLATETLLVFYAPNELAQFVASTALRSWEAFDHVVVRMTATEAATCEVLGLGEGELSDLFAGAA
jgi:hypothetical protein